MVFVVFVVVSTPDHFAIAAEGGLEAAVRALLEPGDRPPIDFSKPVGEPAWYRPIPSRGASSRTHSHDEPDGDVARLAAELILQTRGTNLFQSLPA
jgi:hypothetical protein